MSCRLHRQQQRPIRLSAMVKILLSGGPRDRERVVATNLHSKACSYSSLRPMVLLLLWIASDIFGTKDGSRIFVEAFIGTPRLQFSSCTPCASPPVSHKSLCFYEKKMNRINTTKRTTRTQMVPEATNGLADYAPVATSLFNNMKLPAAVVTAGMISLGFATTFPELPRQRSDNQQTYPPKLRARCEAIKRLHIVVALISVTSELIVVMWAAVEVNQLTERQYGLSNSVWELIQRDCDLAWSAVNSHFVLGIIGFVTMLALRAYVMLLAAEASTALMTAASTGTGAALCLMISIVNRGVESGGGDGLRYGNTILDLFQHYVMLLAQAATDEISPGPLQLLAIILETISLVFMANVLIYNNGRTKYPSETEGLGDIGFDEYDEEEECPVIDILNPTDATNAKVLVNSGNEPFFAEKKEIRAKVARCLEKENKQGTSKDEEDQWPLESDTDTSVSMF